MTPRTPKGYRCLKRGEVRRAGDRVWAYNEGPWQRIDPYMIDIAYEPPVKSRLGGGDFPVIRRKARKTS